jgi:uncharacterized protein YjbI with pentapeptide repeats
MSTPETIRGFASVSRFHRSLLLAASVALVAAMAAPAQASDCRSQPAPGVDWTDCSKNNIVLRGANLARASLVGTDFTMTDLRSSTLTEAKLQKATLVRSSLAGAEATGGDFSRVEAYRTSFASMAAAGANFASAELQRADFASAELSGANFEKAELGRADFEGAVIGGAKFAFANLSRAHLVGATIDAPIDFKGAFMFLTRLEGLDLSTATGLTQAQIDLACGDADTTLPQGLTAPANWPCTFD